MRNIAIPLTTTNYDYLKNKHPEEFISSYKDSVALSMEAVLKSYSYCDKKAHKKIDRKIYPKEILLSYNESKWRRSGFTKISIEHIRVINRMIDVMMKKDFIDYSLKLLVNEPDIEYQRCIVMYCEEIGLSYDYTLFQTLKKRFYRHRKKTNK